MYKLSKSFECTTNSAKLVDKNLSKFCIFTQFVFSIKYCGTFQLFLNSIAMRSVQEVQKAFKTIGFDPKLKPMNHRVLGVLAIVFPGLTSIWIYLIFEANGAEEYMESIFMVTVCTGIFISFASTILNKTSLFSFIGRVDKVLNESKWNFNKLNVLKTHIRKD